MRAGDVDHEPSALLTATEARRLAAARRLDPDKRVRLGQFFTPEPVADLLVRLVDIKSSTLRVLDPGAGVGSLTAALVARVLRESPETALEITAFEIDPELTDPLRQTLDHCRVLAGDRLRTRQRSEDFIRWAANEVAPGLLGVEGEQYDLVLMNPPYRKVSSSSVERRLLATAGIETTNLYTAFLRLAQMLLAPTGQLVAITPRSFCNGTYFRRFRKAFLKDMTLTAIHLFHSRSTAFAGDGVLQENVVFAATKGATPSTVTISTSDGHDDDVVAVREVAHDDVVRPDDPDSFIHIVSDEGSAAVARRMSSLAGRLSDLGLTVSTGRVVDFRARRHLRTKPDASTVPLVYQGHVRTGEVRWPSAAVRKPQHFVRAPEARSQLLPAGYFVLTKRFSAKEERRRVVAGVFDPTRVPCTEVAFENHTNVIHRGNRGLPEALARGLAAFLNSSLVDLYFRQFSGHTQVNSGDLRALRYPSGAELESLGLAVGSAVHDQETLDRLVEEHIDSGGVGEGVAALNGRRKIDEALGILKALDLPREQQNERSALTLLALLGLKPEDP